MRDLQVVLFLGGVELQSTKVARESGVKPTLALLFFVSVAVLQVTLSAPSFFFCASHSAFALLVLDACNRRASLSPAVDSISARIVGVCAARSTIANSMRTTSAG